MNNQIELKKANIIDIDEIINMYAERMKWFKENEIKQWSRYLTNHPKSEFIQSIENGDYYILTKNDKIIAGFEISTDSHFWNDDKTNAYYLYKVVTKVGYKNIGKEIFKIAKQIAKENKKDYLVFTANELDDEGYISTYAYVVNPNKKDNNLYPIETDEEYEFIEKLLTNLDNKIN